MSSYYGNYSQYLGAQRCCNIKTQGTQGPAGPTGPAAVGPMGSTGPTGYTGDIGPSSINTNVVSLTLSSNTITLTPTPTTAISYFTVNLGNGDNVTAINPGTIPAGYQAIVFLNMTTIGTATITTAINSTNNLYSNLNSTFTLTPTTNKYATLIIISDGSVYRCIVTGYSA